MRFGKVDGLASVASRLGVSPPAVGNLPLASPLAGYAVPGLHTAVLSTVVAGCTGTVIAFCLAYGLAYLLTPTRVAGPGAQRGGEGGRASRAA